VYGTQILGYRLRVARNQPRLWQHRNMGLIHGSRPHHPPHVDKGASAVGLRTVATFEALKGIVVLLIGITLLFVHQHAEQFSENLLYRLRIDPDRKLAQMFLNAASQVNDARLWTIAAVVLLYAAVRFTEAWGLWNRRVWAEWFAMLSGALYLPWEILKIVEKADWERIGVLCVNLIVILYMAEIRIRETWQSRRQKRKSRECQQPATKVP
jgi:uncharacterized membrane protein (DUF2068 family)